MAKKVVSLALTEKSIEKLNETSKALGISRSELIELMIKKGWKFPKEVEDAVQKISELQKQAQSNIKKEVHENAE
jgi:metal-responsive CopG/Arc/MetJ family transcriptional regulator